MAKKKPITFGRVSLEEVERLYQGKRDVVKIFGKKICIKATNLSVFFADQHTCSNCGLKGAYFTVEQHHDQKDSEWAYLALYADNNRKFKFTKDHIIPRSKGGANNLKNYQAMCSKCNLHKDNKVNLSDVRKGNCKSKHRIALIFYCITGHSVKT